MRTLHLINRSLTHLSSKWLRKTEWEKSKYYITHLSVRVFLVLWVTFSQKTYNCKSYASWLRWLAQNNLSRYEQRWQILNRVPPGVLPGALDCANILERYTMSWLFPVKLCTKRVSNSPVKLANNRLVHLRVVNHYVHYLIFWSWLKSTIKCILLY